jgi:hypothetical protein
MGECWIKSGIFKLTPTKISEQLDATVEKSGEVDMSPILSGGALRAITDGSFFHHSCSQLNFV